jgi:hypothetical protein
MFFSGIDCKSELFDELSLFLRRRLALVSSHPAVAGGEESIAFRETEPKLHAPQQDRGSFSDVTVEPLSELW